MKVLLNIIWLVLCGFWMAIGYAVAAVASLWLPGGHVAVLEREATEVVHD